MGYDLLNNSEECRLSEWAWGEMLRLARTHGWRPAGTLPPVQTPRSGPWSGMYAGNDWQRVSNSDAYAFRKALIRAKRALKKIRAIEESSKPQQERKKEEDLDFGRDEKLEMIGLCERVIKFLAGGSFIIS